MKLASLLFKSKIQYKAPRFAIILDKANENTTGDLILVYDTEILETYLEQYGKEKEINSKIFETQELNPFVASSISNEIDNECFYSREINYIARNPLYPGSGQLMYAITSKLFDSLITSDRQHSSSNAARTAWSKLLQNSNFKQTDEFDNYFNNGK